MSQHDQPWVANPGYAYGQLRRAIERASNAADSATRKRVAAKAERWSQVLEGIDSGQLLVGSRTPVADTPAWVTLEVVTGGFVTGRYLAEQPLDADEAELLAAHGADVAGSTPRERLNLWFLTDAGQDLLREAMQAARYRVDLPEESALLVVTWLLDHGHDEAVLDLVAELRPLMHRLRFSPRLVDTPRPPGSLVRLRTVAEVRESFRDAETNPRIAAMLRTLRIWNPLYDRLVALWLDTSPDDWAERRTQWLADFHAASAATPFTGRHAHRRSNFMRLKSALDTVGTRPLTAAELVWVRRALANTVTKHGAPGSEQRAALRAVQHVVASRPTNAALAHVLAARLDRFPADGGLPFVDPLAHDVTGEDPGEIAAGTPLPAHFVPKLERALEAPIEELVARGVIGSGEVLARVLPQISAQALATNFADTDLAAVFGQTYTAFRRRRSLLLLNLEHQVRISELPWVAAIEPFRVPGDDSVNAARRALTETTLLALSAFPERILPNPLVRELGALATAAKLDVPLVEEVAADIFMGTFTLKWRRSAARASEILDGTLYERYYDLPPASQWAEPVSPTRPFWSRGRPQVMTADDFAELCKGRAVAAAPGDTHHYVARNGTILEQSQILTTHNVAQLVTSLGLRDQVTALAPDLAERGLAWIARRHLQPRPEWKAELQMLKNTAYAFRQAVLFLSLCDRPTQHAVATAWAAEVAREPKLAPLLPVAHGLTYVVDGGRFDPYGRAADGSPARRFLGWSVGRHWLAAQA